MASAQLAYSTWLIQYQGRPRMRTTTPVPIQGLTPAGRQENSLPEQATDQPPDPSEELWIEVRNKRTPSQSRTSILPVKRQRGRLLGSTRASRNTRDVQKSKNGAMALILEDPYTWYDIIAIQELYLNLYNSIIYCPCSCQYNLIFPSIGRACTCILVNKQIPIAKWYSGQEPDYCWIRLDLYTGSLAIHNVYSKIPDSYDTVS